MKQILVRAPNWIGDQILAYPFFYYLRKAFPKAVITSACVEWVKEIQFKKQVDEVFVLPKSATASIKDRLAAVEEGARLLREKKIYYDLAISLPNSLSTAWFLYRSGAIRRRGYRGDGRRLFLNEALAWDPSPSRHRAQAFLDLLPEPYKPKLPASEFWGILPDNELDPGIPGELENFDAALEWGSSQPREMVEPPDEPYWVLAVGATAESRRWPISYFATLARLVSNELGWRGVIVGGAKEAPLAAQLGRDPTLKLRDYTAQGPVSGLWKVFKNAKFTVTNESGLAHIAALCGSFVQIVCGAADPRRTQPIGPGKVQVAINPVECWPCERNVCSQEGDRKLACLMGISPESVLEEIKRGLGLVKRRRQHES